MGEQILRNDDVRFNNESTKEIHVKNHGKPWLRFWVRWIDYLVLFIIVKILVGAVGGLPQYFEGITSGILMVCSVILLEAICIFSFGTTPGKWLGGIKVKNCEGRNPEFMQALKRTCFVWVQGFCLGIPVVDIPFMWFAKKNLLKDGKTRWDKISETRVEVAELPFWRYGFIVIISFSIVAMLNVSTIDYFLCAYIGRL